MGWFVELDIIRIWCARRFTTSCRYALPYAGKKSVQGSGIQTNFASQELVKTRWAPDHSARAGPLCYPSSFPLVDCRALFLFFFFAFIALLHSQKSSYGLYSIVRVSPRLAFCTNKR